MLQQGQLTPGLTQHCSVQPTPCSPFPLSEGMGASSYPHAFVKHSAPYTRAEHHRSQLQPIPALLLGHRGSKSGHKEAWGSPSTCPTLTPIPHSHPSHSLPSHAHTLGQQAVAPPAPGLHRAAGSGPRSPIGQEGTGSPPSPTAQQGSPHRHAALQEVQSGDAAAVLDAVALQPLQHGHERGRGGLHDVPQLLHAQVFPCGHNGVNARRGARRGGGGGGGRRRAHSRYRTAGSAARTRRGRGGSDARCRAAGAPGSAARRARGSRGRRGPIRGEGCGRAVSGGSAGGDTAPARSSQDGTYRNGWSRSSARPAAQQLQAAAHSASTAGSARHLRRAELSGADRGPTLRSPPPPSRPRAPLPPRHPATAPGHVRERMSPGHVRKRRSRDGRTPSPPTAALRGAALRGSARVAMAVAERRPTRPSPWLGCRRYGCARPHGAGLKAARMGLGGPWRG